MPLRPIIFDAQFMKWVLDVIRFINTNSSQGNSYILTSTDYFTKWKEASALKKEDTNQLISFAFCSLIFE